MILFSSMYMVKATKNELNSEDAIKNLLILLLLKNGVDPKLIESATGIAEKTIRNKFPMNKIRDD